MVNKNRKNPLVYKYLVDREISSDFTKKDDLYSELSHTRGINYYRFKNGYNYSQLKAKFSNKILNILEGKNGKYFPKTIRENTINKIHNIRKQYYSSAKKAILNLDIDSKQIQDFSGYFGHDIYSKLSNSLNKKEYIKKIKNLEEFEFKLLIDSLKNTDYYVKEITEILNIYCGDNTSKKYEYLHYYLIGNLKTFSYDSKLGIEDYFNELGLNDVSKNYKLLKLLIIIRDGYVNFGNINFDFLGDETVFIDIFKLLSKYNHLDRVSPYFDKFNITDEQTRFRFALELANFSDSIGKDIDKFNITNKKYLNEIARVNCGYGSEENLEYSNRNFLNYYQKFDLDDSAFKNLVDYSIGYGTSILDEYFNPNNFEDFIYIVKIFFSKRGLLEEEFLFILEYTEVNYPDKKSEVLTVISQILSHNGYLKQNFQNIKNIFGRNDKNNQILSKASYDFILKENYKILIDTLGVKLLIDTHKYLFETKSDILLFLEVLVEIDLITKDVYRSILSENKTVGSILNFISLLFINSKNKKIENIELRDKNISKKNKNKVLSRKLFFPNIGFDFPENNFNYKGVKLEELYFLTYSINIKLGKDFFKELEINKEMFLPVNILELIAFFKNISNLVDSGKIFGTFDAHEYISNLRKFDFDKILTLQKSNLKSIDIRNLDKKNIKNINAFLFELTKNIFISKFENIKLSNDEFTNLVEKWGDISSLLSIISYRDNSSILEVVKRIIETDGKNEFLDYKYSGYNNCNIDTSNAENQIGRLDDDKLDVWKNNYAGIVKYKEKTYSKAFEYNLGKEIYSGLVQHSHLDEIRDGYKDYILGLEVENNEYELLKDLNNITNFQEFYDKYSNIGDDRIRDLLFHELVGKKSSTNFVNIINFIKRLDKNNSLIPKSILAELNTFLKNNSKNNKSMNKENDVFILSLEIDNPKVLLEIGDMVSGDYSCQSVKTKASQMIALPGYVIDAGIKALLSFEITSADFSNDEEMKEFENLINSGDYDIISNLYKLEVNIGRFNFKLNKALARNIMKLGFKDKFSNTPVVFLEKTYKSVTGNKLNFIERLHEEIKDQKVDNLEGTEVDKKSFFPGTRNELGVYVDANSRIVTGDYTLDYV